MPRTQNRQCFLGAHVTNYLAVLAYMTASWPTVIVAVAGIAGVMLGAWLTAKAQATNLHQQIVFEARRDRRRVYAAALAALETVHMARESATDDPDSRMQGTAAGLAVSAVRLVAPYDVGDAAREALHAVLGRSDARVDFHSAHAELLKRMRNDIGRADTDSASPDGVIHL